MYTTGMLNKCVSEFKDLIFKYSCTSFNKKMFKEHLKRFARISANKYLKNAHRF